MSKKTRPSPRFIFTFLLAFLVAGCQPKATPTEQSVSTSPSTSTETIPDASAPQMLNSGLFLDPSLAQDKDSLTVAGYLYEGLVTLDESGGPQPGLAESWVISDDQLDYIFTMRPGLVFSDGSAITPDIVVDNFNRWFDPKNPLHKGGDYSAWKKNFLGFLGEKDADNRTISTVDGIQKVDSNTVLLHLSRPAPDTLKQLADPAFAILYTNAVAIGNYGTQESTIISSGPYIVSSWNDQGLTLSPNTKYWGKVPTSDLNFTWR